MVWLMSQVLFAQSVMTSELATDLMLQNLGLAQTAKPENVETTVTISADGSQVVRVVLKHSGTGDVHLLLKGEAGFLNRQDQQLRTAMIISGFFTGEESVHLLGKISGVVLVGFEYPYRIEDFQQDPGKILHFVRQTPGHIALALRWLSEQSWSNPQALSVVAVSLGGVFAPSGLHLSQKLGVRVDKTVFICTGADISSMLEFNLKPYIAPMWMGPLLSLLTAPMMLADPKLHLPELGGSFLSIQTTQDTVIPRSAQETLFHLLKNPKQEILIEGPHINSDQTEMIQKIQDILFHAF